MRQAMMNSILVLLIGLLNLPNTTPCVTQDGQCGGLQYTGETDCCAPSTCEYSNPWYSQCIPSSAPSTTGCGALWDQCGGQNWSGATCCDYSTCTYSNPYYSQCLPSSSSSSSTSSSTDSTSSSSNTDSTSSSSNTDSTSSSSSTDSTSSSSTTASASSTDSSTSTTARTSSSSTTATNQSCSALYRQCGGLGWNGPTTCCSGSTCTFGNAYYSQCLSSGGSFTTSTSSSSFSGSGSNTVSSITISSGNGNQQSGVTTRYWDCCKPSCGWPGKASVSSPVQTCEQDGVTPIDSNTQSACVSGSAYMCNNQQPWNVSSTLSYGYAAAVISGEGESDWCCACYLLTFTSKSITGKQMIVQVTNTGGDLGGNQFDLAIPGGGFGIYDGCSGEFGPSYSWGAQYGGVSQQSDCNDLPPPLQSGCNWRFGWFENANNPTINFRQVPCPSVLTANTQCIRD